MRRLLRGSASLLGTWYDHSISKSYSPAASRFHFSNFQFYLLIVAQSPCLTKVTLWVVSCSLSLALTRFAVNQ
ncbi:hypothetical protein P152DRAFT_457736 [Eremomyces bilateralis CBS 781.70]|uniref:Uncharacterized protein n=1 Tax=Eremomyces bilateralis CBS 781.70 TaxID=1392243 RepID=A0A6G1G5S5_9PEZI|nr:uncharacterized protein P152DRAFT_457736 [Eremomyces bilateralis CBS 781.70]KAF1813378.1 hypothetical protein P152DRAFT_457736 [Eremomyces bilateralis CBS 781.70]